MSFSTLHLDPQPRRLNLGHINSKRVGSEGGLLKRAVAEPQISPATHPRKVSPHLKLRRGNFEVTEEFNMCASYHLRSHIYQLSEARTCDSPAALATLAEQEDSPPLRLCQGRDGGGFRGTRQGALLERGLARVTFVPVPEGLPAGVTVGFPGLGVAGAREGGRSNQLE